MKPINVKRVGFKTESKYTAEKMAHFFETVADYVYYEFTGGVDSSGGDYVALLADRELTEEQIRYLYDNHPDDCDYAEHPELSVIASETY